MLIKPELAVVVAVSPPILYGAWDDAETKIACSTALPADLSWGIGSCATLAQSLNAKRKTSNPSPIATAETPGGGWKVIPSIAIPLVFPLGDTLGTGVLLGGVLVAP